MSIAVPTQYRTDVQTAARKTGLSPNVVAAQINEESGFNPGAVSPTGAEGIAQFEPGTWASWGHGSPFNAGDAFSAYAAYMGSLIKEFHGNVRDALAAYNAGPGDLSAGYGYADTILANAGEGVNYTAAGGTGGGTGGGGSATGGVQQAQLDSFLSTGSGGVLSDAGALLHGSAVALDRAFGMFAPGNGWRLVFTTVCGLSAFGAWRAYRTGGGQGDGNAQLPLAISLTGVALVAGFLAFRPWPQTSDGPIKPGAYIVDVLHGEPPPPGPETVSQPEVRLTEDGLGTLLALWAAGKAGNAANGIFGAAGNAGGALGKLWGWIKGLGQDAEEGAGEAG